MKHTIALLRKEALQTIRDPKQLVLWGIFAFFGMISPLTAKLLPDLIRMMSDQPSMAGIVFQLPEPDAWSAYEQWIKNLSQMGMLAVLLVFMGAVSQEKADGSAALILTKGVSRGLYLLAKWTAAFVNVTIGFLVSAGVFLGYAEWLFGGAILPQTPYALFLVWASLMFFTAMAMLASTLCKTTGMSALVAFGLLALLLIAGTVPAIGAWSPVALSDLPLRILRDLAEPDAAYGPLCLSLCAVPIFWGIGLLRFSREEL